MSNKIQYVIGATTAFETAISPVRQDGNTVVFNSYDGVSEFYTQVSVTAPPASANGRVNPSLSITEPVIRVVDGVSTRVDLQSANVSFSLTRKATLAERTVLRNKLRHAIDLALMEDLVDELKGFY